MTGIPVAYDELVGIDMLNEVARGHWRKSSSKTVAGTTTATDLLNGEVTIDARAMGLDKILRLTAWGDWKQNSGSGRDVPAFQLIFGGATVIDTDSSGGSVVSSSSARFGWKIQCEILNLAATRSQWATFSGWLGFAPAGPESVQNFTTGEGYVFADNAASISNGRAQYLGSNTGSVDTTSSCPLLLKVKNANSSANYETKLYGALVEII